MRKRTVFFGVFFFSLFSTVVFAADIMSDFESDDVAVGKDSLSSPSEKKSRAMGAFLKAYMGKNKNQDGPQNFKDYIELLKNDPKSKYGLLFFLSEWNLDNDKENKLVEELVPVASENPDAYQLNVIAATALVKAGKKDAAIELLENSLDTFSDKNTEKLDIFSCLKALALLCELHEQNKSIAKGERLLDKFSEYENLKNDLHFNQFSAEFFARAAELSDNSGWLWFTEGDKDRFERKARASLKALEELAESAPRQAAELTTLVATFRKLKDPQGGERLILNNLLWNPDDFPSQVFLAMYLYDTDRPAEALRLWKTIFENNPKTQANFYFEMGRAALRCKKYADAVNAFEWFLLSHPDNEAAIFQLAVAYYESGLYKKALAKLKKIEGSVDGRYLASLVLRGLGRHKEALKQIQEAETLAAKDKRDDFLSKNFYLTMAYTADKAKDPAATEKCLLKLLKSFPDDPEIKNFTAYLWADNKTNLEAAEKLVREALAAEPENSAYLDTLAWALHRAGKDQEALPVIKKALEKDGLVPDAVIADHAGDIYESLGDKEKALEMWRKALGIHSEDADKPDILKKIKRLQKKDNARAD